MRTFSCPCPCGKNALPVVGAVIYPHIPYLAQKLYFQCECGRYVGAHYNGKPMGIPADAETRAARVQAHRAFDPLWQSGRFLSRGAAYRWLSDAMGEKQVHIGETTKEQADRIVAICTAKH